MTWTARAAARCDRWASAPWSTPPSRAPDGAGSGAVRSQGYCALVDTTVQGAFSCANNTTTYLYGTIDLQGPLQLNSIGNTTDLRIQSSPLVLAGSGGIVGSNTTANRIMGGASDIQLVIAAESSIHGSMQLGANFMNMANHGLIEADTSAGMLLDLTDSGPNSNDGMIRASNGATLTIYPTTIDNTGGTIEAAKGSFVHLYNSTVVGGTLRDADGAGSGAVRSQGYCALVDTTVQGAFSCANNTTTYLYGTIDLQGPLQADGLGRHGGFGHLGQPHSRRDG